jgi:signal transduction histidine kinase
MSNKRRADLIPPPAGPAAPVGLPATMGSAASVGSVGSAASVGPAAGFAMPVGPAAGSPAGWPGNVPTYPRLYRDRDDRIVAGVASGIAQHLRLPTIIVRVVFVALLVANGLGALLYVAFWAVLPVRPRDDGPAPSRRRSANVLQRLALAALVAGVVVLQTQLRIINVDPAFVVLTAVVALGAGIIWHQAEPRRRQRTAAPANDPTPVLARPADAAYEAVGDRRWFFVRVIGGGLLVILGIIGILGFFGPGQQNLPATLWGMAFALLALAGVVVALAPVLWRIVAQLREERVARIREQERAEVAAIVHDQVLHTLALIQRNANDSTSVLRLARGQERSLRGWLYKPTGSPSERFAAALEQAAAEVEDTYGITVETVVVGDADHDERVAAMVAATREALVNAARHARVGTVSLYAESEDDQLTVYVRDRGAGFDMSHMDEDRHGVRGSIVGRMQRHGGVARVRSTPGEGTEVELTMRRTPIAGTAGRDDAR